MPLKADTGWICSYAVLRYLVDPEREITVPLGVVLWNVEQNGVWFRLPRHGEAIEDVVPVAQACSYAETVRDKIVGWHRLGELPYQSEPLLPLSDAWWEAVGQLLQWRVRLGTVRRAVCRDPETELERLYRALVKPVPQIVEGVAERLPQEDPVLTTMAE